MTRFSTQTEFNNFIQRSGALEAQVGYQWVKARDEGAINTDLLYKQFQTLRFIIRALCPTVIGATDNLLTDEEIETGCEKITSIGNLCDTNYLLNDTIQ